MRVADGNGGTHRTCMQHTWRRCLISGHAFSMNTQALGAETCHDMPRHCQVGPQRRRSSGNLFSLKQTVACVSQTTTADTTSHSVSKVKKSLKPTEVKKNHLSRRWHVCRRWQRWYEDHVAVRCVGLTSTGVQRPETRSLAARLIPRPDRGRQPTLGCGPPSRCAY
jgi:hypothetical protein